MRYRNSSAIISDSMVKGVLLMMSSSSDSYAKELLLVLRVTCWMLKLIRFRVVASTRGFRVKRESSKSNTFSVKKNGFRAYILELARVVVLVCSTNMHVSLMYRKSSYI
jgi:hypothetical protein